MGTRMEARHTFSQGDEAEQEGSLRVPTRGALRYLPASRLGKSTTRGTPPGWVSGLPEH